MNLELEVQNATSTQALPAEADFRQWVRAALEGRRDDTELTLRIVDSEESRELNRRYRGQDRPTNVLSFPFEAPPPVVTSLLGDLVICAPVVTQEAREQGKAEADHWTHLVVHGVFHLLGYDHLNDAQAEEMEGLEREILAGLGIADPYA